MTNDFRFPNEPTVIAQGGTITFYNKTSEGHTVALVTAGAVPKNTTQVDNCVVCNSINGALGFSNGPGPPAGAQLDNGKAGDAGDDADAPDTGAINSAKAPLPPQSAFPFLIEDFDTASHGSTVGDATIIDTTNKNGGGMGFPTQRTIVVGAKPGLYHYMCSFHAWMQGEIRVIG